MDRNPMELDEFDQDFAPGGEVECDEIEESDESEEIERLEACVRAARLAGA